MSRAIRIVESPHLDKSGHAICRIKPRQGVFRVRARRWLAAIGRATRPQSRAPAHGLAGPGRSEAARRKINDVGRLASVAACAPPCARAGGHAVRTARLRRGIVAFTHPRTGGAHDSHHWTAGIAGRSRRRGGGVAARRSLNYAPDRR